MHRVANEPAAASDPAPRPSLHHTRSTIIDTGSSAESIGNARDALAQSAFNRLRFYRAAMITWCLLGSTAAAFMPGQMRDRIICWGSVGIFLASYLFRKVADQPSRSIQLTFPVALVQCVGAVGVSVGLGLASPFNALLVIGLILYCLSAPQQHARAVFVFLLGSYAAFAVLDLANVLSGTGLLCPYPLPFGTKLANYVWIEATLATGYVVGRLANRDSSRLVAELERVVRQAARREALLLEARDELARAAAVGGRGPFTDVELGSFRLGNVIGRGGMGEVYTASRLDGAPGELAVKLLRRDVLTQPEIVRRFEREARVVASLESPYVVKVHEVGGESAPLPYIAMERLRGEDLVTILRARSILKLEDVSKIVREVCAGLAVAHKAGVIHRDLKPANLFLTEYGNEIRRWKILDFGISKLVDADEASLTASEVLGTPQYMSPEQAGGSRSIDGRADLYGMGLIVYRALTGHLAFPKGEMADVLQAVMHDMPADPRARRASIPEDVADVLRIALAKRPEDRFASAMELAEAFEAAVNERLSPEWRAHAAELSRAQPWGSRGRR